MFIDDCQCVMMNNMLTRTNIGYVWPPLFTLRHVFFIGAVISYSYTEVFNLYIVKDVKESTEDPTWVSILQSLVRFSLRLFDFNIYPNLNLARIKPNPSANLRTDNRSYI